MSEELVNKLRKAGINASLVHRIQDETCIEIESMPDTVDSAKALTEYCLADVQASIEFYNLMMEGSGVGFDLPVNNCTYVNIGDYGGFKPGQLALPPVIAPRTTPPKSWFWLDYMVRQTLSKEEHDKYEEMAQHLREYKEDSKRLKHIISRHGYIETPMGARRYLSSRDMGDNSTLR